MTMSNESRRLAGILLIVLPTVMYGGVSVLSLLIGDPKYMETRCARIYGAPDMHMQAFGSSWRSWRCATWMKPSFQMR